MNLINKIGCQLNFTLRSNSKWNQTITFTNESDNSPIDLTVYSEIHCQVRLKPESPIIIEMKLSDGTFTVTNDNELNIIGVNIPNIDLCPKTYRYDVFFIGTNVKDCLLYGSITIIDSITE